MRKHCVFRKLIVGDYLQVAGHHQNEEFAVRGKEPKDEVQIYTWKDAAVYELSDLLSPFYRCFYLCHFEEDKMLIYTSKESRFISWLHTTRCNNDISSRMLHSSTL